MNIPLKKEQLVLSAIDEYGKYFQLTDTIGFTTADGVPGFNRADAGELDDAGVLIPEYVDSQGNPYPKIREAVLTLLPYINRYHSEDIDVVSFKGAITREDEALVDDNGNSIDVDYEEVDYNHEVILKGDGWYTVYAFLIDAIDSSAGDAALPGIYYDKAIQKFIDGSTGNTVQVADLLDMSGVISIDLQYFVTPNMESKLHGLTGDMVDVAITKGDCSKEYRKAQRVVHFFESQISGAHVKFNDGYRLKSQQIIEDLENSNPYVEC
jgi:hypothetical protein